MNHHKPTESKCWLHLWDQIMSLSSQTCNASLGLSLTASNLSFGNFQIKTRLHGI